MPYEETLRKKAIPEWLNFYIDYKTLKELIRPFILLQKSKKSNFYVTYTLHDSS